MSFLNLIRKRKIVSKEENILLEYISMPVLNAHNLKIFKEIILNHAEMSENVYRQTTDKRYSHTRMMILTELNKHGHGIELAYEEAHNCAYGMEFLDSDCSNDEEVAFRKWFACETDEMPTKMPKPKYTIMGGNSIADKQIACMSLVCEHTARQCVYGLSIGFVDAFKWPVREMLAELGEPYTKEFLSDLIKQYGITEEDCMLMYSAIYSVGHKTKKETEFYYKYIEQWLAHDKIHYRETIMKIAGQDIGKKIIKKLDLK